MTFLAPMFLAGGALVAGAIILLHFLARRRPRPAVLPTARFVPDRPARWPSPAPKPTDWLLLALRVLAIMVVATAFAGLRREPDRAATSRIVLVDRSRAVADERAMRDSALAVLRDGDILIAYDTVVRVTAANARDTAAVLTRSPAPASLSVALIAAERAAPALRDRADSIELVIVSPFPEESWDDATPALRARWPARARLVTLALTSPDSAAPSVDVRAPRNDPVNAAAAPLLGGEGVRARIVRSAPAAADSAWARGSDRVLIHWPRAGANDSSTAEGVIATDAVLVARLVRRALPLDDGPIIGRFADGAPAIVEHALGDGCIRDVGFDFPIGGDVVLRESARRLLAVVVGPCGGTGSRRMLSAGRLSSLRGSGTLLATTAVSRPDPGRSAATPWLLIAGALLLLLELGARRRAASA